MIDAIRRALIDKLELDVTDIRLAAGGDINDAYRAETASGSIFIKSSTSALPGMFTAEAAGLEWLGEPGAVAVPEVIGVCDDDDAPRLLALEWIDGGRLGAAGEEALGRGLAKTHAAGAPSFGATPMTGGVYGHEPMRFNELALSNDVTDTWADFYAQRRLLPLAHESHRRGSFDADGVELIERVAGKITELAGPEEPPSRTHGDLWSGNILADQTGKPYLIDPVAHGGHREVDLALLTVFGGPSQRCFDAYEEVAPLHPGFEERKPLWQLAMILLHVYLFGGSYAQQAKQIALIYA
jgi:fructosamine-3-kinase